VPWEFAGQQFFEGLQFAFARGGDQVPRIFIQFFYRDRDRKGLRPGALHQSLDLACADLEIQDRSAPDIASAPSNPVAVISIGFKVLVPRLAPPGARNDAAFDVHGPKALLFSS